MKRILLTPFFALIVCLSHAQWKFQAFAEYDYTRTLGNGGSLALLADYQMNEAFMMSLGMQGCIGGPHAVNLLWQNDLLTTQKGTLFLENRYLYRLFPQQAVQEFNALLDIGWRNRHFNFQLGLCNRYMAEIPLRNDGGMGTIFEPMNVSFCAEGHLFDNSHPWNIGARISNYDDFIIERFTLFFYCLSGYYDIQEHLRLTGEFCLHPCGTLNLSSQPNGFCTHIGIIWTPKKESK